MKNQTDHLRTWIELDRAAVRHNYQAFRQIINPKCQLMAVIKSNAYGHGLIDFSREADKAGVDWFGVDSIVEAEALRRTEIKKPILVLGYTRSEKIKEALNQDFTLTIADEVALKNLKKIVPLNQKLKIHLKIDTGMHRQGFLLSELPVAIKVLKQSPGITLTGVYTHFTSAKNPAFPDDTNRQLTEFIQAVTQLKAAGFKNLTRHAAATSGTIIFPNSHLDLVRIGIGSYGLWPSRETEAAFKNKFELRPVLTWKTIVAQIKTLPAGSRIGYDLTETLTRPSKVALLPVGYWHGLPRVLSSIGTVMINRTPAKILGRISMDMISVDATKVKDLKVGDEVILIGRGLPAENFADLSSTTNYEIVTHINPLIKKIVI